MPRDQAAVAGTARYLFQLYLRRCEEYIFAVPFHPEKSQSAALRLLSNFVSWDGNESARPAKDGRFHASA